VNSSDTDEVLRYNGGTGAFIDAFVAAGSGGMDSPRGLVFGPDDNLYVSSAGSDQVLRYSGITGAFINVFVTVGSGGLDSPRGLIFGPDNNLYVCSFDSDQVIRYSGQTGAFIDVFVTAGSGGLNDPKFLVFFIEGGRGSGSNTCSLAPQNSITGNSALVGLLGYILIPAVILVRRRLKK